METNNLYFENDKVWLAEMKYYSKEENGIEYSEPLTYAFIVDLGDGEFANPFDVSEDLPVFERMPYGNYTKDGEGYGTKVRLVSNVDKTGACYVLNKNVKEMGVSEDIVYSEKLVDYMFESGLFFKDRRQFAREKMKRKPFSLRKFLEEDEKRIGEMKTFLAERKAHIRLIK